MLMSLSPLPLKYGDTCQSLTVIGSCYRSYLFCCDYAVVLLDNPVASFCLFLLTSSLETAAFTVIATDNNCTTSVQRTGFFLHRYFKSSYCYFQCETGVIKLIKIPVRALSHVTNSACVWSCPVTSQSWE
jgi:hypothetical protein